MKILHVITGLNVGGAETMLAKLLKHGIGDAEVLSLLTPGAVAPRIEQAGVTIHSAEMRRSLPSLRSVHRVLAAARAAAPQIVQGWMHHGNLAASLAALAVRPRPHVVWNIRHSLSDIGHEKPLSRAVLRVGRTMSRTPAAIIYNSSVAARQFEAFGYDATRTIVIPNGFDCRRFRPRDGAGPALRSQFGIAAEPIVVAMVARLHPMKDAANLIEAVRRARAMGHDLHLLMAGNGTDMLEPALASQLRSSLPEDRVTLAGERYDVADWLPGVDIVALPSAWGEGFPNILGEAMACGVPCVATDIGDSAAILGECGEAVPPRDPAALAAAIARLASLGREGRGALGAAGRVRVVSNYSLDNIAGQYSALYERVAAACESARRVAPTHSAWGTAA